MALVNYPIPALFNGVSQQPPSIRAPSQAEAMDNAYPDVATGVRKRPAATHIAKLSWVSSQTSFVHWIDQKAGNRFVLRIRSGAIQVWDIVTGQEMDVLTPDGTGYLVCSDPGEDIVALTVADYTFIVNKGMVVEMAPDLVPGTIAAQKQKFSDLAAGTGSGSVYEIVGDSNSAFDNYYVKDQTVYTETARPGTEYKLERLTMPHQLIRTGPTEFTFSACTWGERTVGDASSNPDPSFVGQQIQDIFFYRYRLGILAGDSIVLSRAGSYFNFWASTVTAAIDSDPIDVSAAHNKMVILRSAVSFNKTTMLFSNGTQFQMSADGALSARTVALDPTTEFECRARVRPASAGQTLFFATARGNHSSVREYYVEPDTLLNDAADITAHAPKYLPGDVFLLATSTSEDLLIVAGHDKPNELFVYKHYWSGNNEKIQSAWGRWVFGTSDYLLGAFFQGTNLYLAFDRPDGFFLEVMDLEDDVTDGDLPFSVLLDRKVSLTGSYNATTNVTSWTLPFEESDTVEAVLGGEWGNRMGTKLALTRLNETTFLATGDLTAYPVWLGRAYTMRYRFSRAYARDSQQNALTTATLKLLHWGVTYNDTGYFRAEVSQVGKDTAVYHFPGNRAGAVVLGAPTLHEGTAIFPVAGDSKETTIELINDSHLPCKLLSANWEGDLHQRNQGR